MSIFHRPRVIVWPKAQSLEIYQDKKENNVFFSEINLWQDLSEADFQSLTFFLKKENIKECLVLVPDDVVITRSFLSDSQTTSIDTKEVIGLAESFVHFRMDPGFVDYTLVPGGDKTIIQAHIFQKDKIEILKNNLSKLGLTILKTEAVSASISRVISSFSQGEYFFIYPCSKSEITLVLSKNDSVYLATNLKRSSLDIQKLINYSKLYFTTIVTKIFVPKDIDLDLVSISKLEKTEYSETQIASEFKKTSNLPLPVLGLIIDKVKDINSPSKTMENKKNILPFIAVFVLTAAIASIIIWFVVNRDTQDSLSSPSGETPTPTITEEVLPTNTPIPTIAEISKTTKLQVLNATDINGQAATLKSKLTTLGFTSIAVGNSPVKVTGNLVKLKASLASDSAYFKEKLTASFDAVYESTLKESSTYDVIFYIGSDISQGPGTPATASSSSTPVPIE